MADKLPSTSAGIPRLLDERKPEADKASERQQRPPRPTICADCNGALSKIQLLDRDEHGGHRPLEYAADLERRDFWKGRVPQAGRIEALMCERCGRMLLFAEPYEGG